MSTPAAAAGAVRPTVAVAGRPAAVTHRQQHRVGRAPGGGDRLRVPEDRQQHRQRMRPDVPQPALGPAPGRIGVRAGAVLGEHRAEPVGVRGEPAPGRGLRGDPLALLRPEARGEEDHRGDARPVGGIGEGTGLGHGGGDRLVQEKVAKPASAARTASGTWTAGGRAIATASHTADSSSGSAYGRVSCTWASAAAASARRPQIPASSTPGCAARAGAWTRRAQGPVPRSPMRRVVMGSVSRGGRGGGRWPAGSGVRGPRGRRGGAAEVSVTLE